MEPPPREREPAPALKLAPILRRIAAGYRDDWRMLLVAGLIVFVPIDLILAFDLVGDGDWTTLGTGTWIVEIALLVAQIVLPMLGNVFYAGIVASGETERRYGIRRDLRVVARELPYLTLAVADVLLAVVIVFGFVLLIVPGIAAMVWFSLVAPVIEIERTGPVAAFRRSFRLVRGHFWKVAGVVLPLVVIQAVLMTLGDDAGHSVFGSGFLGDWIGSVAANLLSSAFWALAILALYVELRMREKGAGEAATTGSGGLKDSRPRVDTR